MPKASVIQTSFNAGELSPTLDGRVDLAKYGSGCSKMENFIPLVQGGALKRSGTRFVREVKDSTKVTRLIPFEFNTDQAYILEFGHEYMRVYRDGGAVTEPTKAISATTNATPVAVTITDAGVAITGATQANPVVVTSASHGFQDGDLVKITGVVGMTEINDREFTVAGKTTDTFQLSGENGTLVTDATCDTTDGDATVTMDSTASIKVGQVVDGSFTDATCDTTEDPTVTMDSTAAVKVGMTVTGSGIPAGATIASVHGGGTTFELSAAATAVANNITLTFNPIDSDTTVASVGTGTLELSKVALATKTNATLKFGAAWSSGGLATGHKYLTGEEIYLDSSGKTSLDGRFWTITRTGALTFTLDDSTAPGLPVATTGTVARVFTLATPYLSTALESIQYAQSADVLFLAHPDRNPRKVTRADHHVWTIEIITFDQVPFEPTNPDKTITVKASAATGDDITLTQVGGTGTPVFGTDLLVGSQFKFSEIVGSHHGLWESSSANLRYSGTSVAASGTAYFENNVYALVNKTAQGGSAAPITGTSPPIHDTGNAPDGRWTWEYLHSGEGYATIKTVDVNGLSATADVVRRLPASVVGADNETHRWSHGAWSGKNGYPRTVSFFEDRLWWGGTDNNPQTLWASKTSDYENHHIIDLDESALIFTLNTDQVNVIEWINAGKVLLIGTAGGEFVCSAGTETEALVPGNVRVVRHSTYGSKTKVAPQRVEQVLLFVQRAGRKLREFVFDDSLNSYVAPDMTVLADHITATGMTRLAFQQEPNRLIWATLGNGSLICFTYERSQQVTAWHRHTIGGTGSTVESIAVIPHPDGDKDRLWMIVNRTVNGSTKRYIEYLESDWDRTDAVTSAFFVDSGLSYSGASTTTIIGLDHLEGETVSILADGATHPDKTVSSGSITLDRACTTAQIGLAYSSTLQTMRLEAGAADGTAQGKTKRFTNVVIRLDQTGSGLLYGPNDTDADMDELHLRDSYNPMDTALPLFDGDTEVLSWPEGYEQIGRLTLKHTLPLPCTITAIMPQVVTQDR